MNDLCEKCYWLEVSRKMQCGHPQGSAMTSEGCIRYKERTQ